MSHVFEIAGTGTHNRGAELMAAAIVQRFRARNSSVKIAVSPRFGSFDDRSRYGLRILDAFPRYSLAKVMALAAPRSFVEALGLVRSTDVTAVLDASGLAIADNMDIDAPRRLLRMMNRPWRRRQKLILLPQAFGPLEKPEVRDLCRQVISRAELVFARDDESYSSLISVNPAPKVRLCPDFTGSLQPASSEGITLSGLYAAIVPNVRMLDKTNDVGGRKYFAFLKATVEIIKGKGITPALVLHDQSEDRGLVPRLVREVGQMQLIESTDPLVLKGVLGGARVVVASRYHALVSALSQGVPCIGAGWSHKYKWLFNDYGCAPWLVKDLADISGLSALMNQIFDCSERASLVSTIQSHALKVEEQVAQMWRDVESCVGLS